jgi:hypothetical protein
MLSEQLASSARRCWESPAARRTSRIGPIPALESALMAIDERKARPPRSPADVLHARERGDRLYHGLRLWLEGDPAATALGADPIKGVRPCSPMQLVKSVVRIAAASKRQDPTGTMTDFDRVRRALSWGLERRLGRRLTEKELWGYQLLRGLARRDPRTLGEQALPFDRCPCGIVFKRSRTDQRWHDDKCAKRRQPTKPEGSVWLRVGSGERFGVEDLDEIAVLRECEECREPFWAATDRERFCPVRAPLGRLGPGRGELPN